jgi:hypothetical protein
MPYTIYRGDTVNPSNLMADVESFFIYIHFDVKTVLGTVGINGGYWAVCCSGLTDKYPQGRPEMSAEPQSYYVKSANNNGFILKRSRLLGSRKVEFGNEFTDLHLFQFTGEPVEPVESVEPTAPNGVPWVDLEPWAITHGEPSASRNKRPLLVRRLTLAGLVENRYAHALSTTEDGMGTSSLSVAMAFDAPTCLASVVGLHGQPMAQLDIWTGGPRKPGQEKVVARTATPWSYFTPVQLASNASLPGAPVGFVMVAQGAFKAIAWEEIDEWYLNGVSEEVLLRQLRKVVRDYGLVPHEAEADLPRKDPYLRTLENVFDTNCDGVVSPSPSDPIEVIHFGKLNNAANAPVPGII